MGPLYRGNPDIPDRFSGQAFKVLVKPATACATEEASNLLTLAKAWSHLITNTSSVLIRPHSSECDVMHGCPTTFLIAGAATPYTL